jgi:hypothetical protein
MQLCSAVLLTPMMIWFYFLYESPRWQLTNGQIDRAEITIRKALKQNGRSDKNLKEQLNQLTTHLQRVKYFLVSLRKLFINRRKIYHSIR